MCIKAPVNRYGSSPRLRGTHFPPRRQLRNHRFIPAFAGNTGYERPRTGGHPVHPRVCGEHGWKTGTKTVISGSSPRLRGTRTLQRIDVGLGRFIPAFAGNTSTEWCILIVPSVHPRVCGEHGGRNDARRSFGGSSPRLRGTRAASALGIQRSRFIPAFAGNTRIQNRRFRLFPVHPRVCGEHQIMKGLCIVVGGSSPRLRGTLVDLFTGLHRPRFIPAFAGNTPGA